MKNSFFVMFFVLFRLATFSQEIKHDPFWDKSEEDKQEIALDYYNKKGIILLDSLTTEKIRLFLYTKGAGIYTLNEIYGPYHYNVQDLISDSLNTIGIFMFGVTSSHPSKYLVFKNGNKLLFLDKFKLYKPDKLVRRILRFIKKHNNKFSKDKEIQIWENLTNFYKKFDGYFGPPKPRKLP